MSLTGENRPSGWVLSAKLFHSDSIHLQSPPSVNIYGLQRFLQDAVPRPLSQQQPLQVEQLSPATQQLGFHTVLMCDIIQTSGTRF